MRKTKKNTALRTLIESQLEGTKQLVYNEGTENELKVKVYIAIPFNKKRMNRCLGLSVST